MERLNKTLPFCQMVREAWKSSKPFYFTNKDEAFFGTMVLGMADTPSFAEAGLLGKKFEIFEDARANKRTYHYIPRIPKGTVNYMAVSGLDELAFEPDLLLLMASPS